MVHQVKATLDHPIKYMQHNGRTSMDTEVNLRLEEHCKSIGFPVGVYDIDKLDETGFAAARNDTFGASDSAVLLGVAYSSRNVTMKTKDELLNEKVNNFWNEEISSKASVRKGKDLEVPIIVPKLEEMLNAYVLKPKDMYVNKKGLATNFDGVLFEAEINDEDLIIGYHPVPLEIKVCTVWARKNYDWNKAVSEFDKDIKLEIPKDLPLREGIPIEEHIELKATHFGIPKYYYTQLQQQIMFLGADHGHLAVMDDSEWTIYIFTVPRDDVVIKALEIESFHQYARLCKKKGLPMPK